MCQNCDIYCDLTVRIRKEKLKENKLKVSGRRDELIRRLKEKCSCNTVPDEKVPDENVTDEKVPDPISVPSLGKETQRPNDKNYGSWTVNQLREELKTRGNKTKTAGCKDVLIERLQFYDKNNNFSGNVLQIPENFLNFKFQWPLDSEYKSVSGKSEVPPMDVVHITMYFLKEYSNGFGMSEYEAVHRKGYSMMMNYFLRALTEVKVDTSHFFYRAQVNSEFTKSLTYFVLLAVDSAGVILQSQCECAAGAGPHAVCKHVAVLCYSLLHFKDNSEWPIKLTVTQKKQAWHLPKKRKIEVSPMKAEEFSYNISVYHVEKRKTGRLCYDPRMKESKPQSSFSDCIRNGCINYANTGKHPLGLSGIFDCASTAALVHDHHYLLETLDTQFIRNLIAVSPETAKRIEMLTRKQSDSREWHSQRALRITASKIGEICHFTDRRDKVKYAETLVSGQTIRPTEAMLWGKTNEAKAIAEYERLAFNEVKKCGLFVSPEFPFLAASPDGLICEGTVLEVKCPFSIRDEIICAKNYPHIQLDGDVFSLKKTSHYYYQCQLQMFVTGREYCDFFVYTNVNSLLIRFGKDPIVIEEIISKGKHFYEDFVLPELKKKYFPLF